MRDFAGKVAVVTGAGSGFGRAMAEGLAKEGMKVVLAGINKDTIEAAAAELRGQGHDVLPVQADVSKYESVEALARRTVEVYGGVHVLFNNAGVQVDRDWAWLHPEGKWERVWELPLNDWQWSFGVNFWGVVHGLKAFVPIMLEQGAEGHIINIASPMGYDWPQQLVIYATAKACVNRLSESLYLQLKGLNAPIGVTLLLPGPIRTRLYDASRNRPPELSDEGLPEETIEQRHERIAKAKAIFDNGYEPEHIVNMTLQAVRDDRFYVFTEPGPVQEGSSISRRFATILAERNPGS